MTPPIEARRITGPHLLGDRPGAALDVPLAPEESGRVVEWEANARRLLALVGWSDETTAVRRFPAGANLFVSAPLDGLYAATDLAEIAWESAGGTLPADAVARLRDRIASERNPALLALEREARRRGLTFLHDDDGVSVGSGTGVQVWEADAIPDPAGIDWRGISDVPIGLVTGSNGKTSTVRLAAAMAREAGRTPGYTTTDGVAVGREIILPTDYAGPMGARAALRDPRVTVAILETARGGILRRGLAVRRADAAVITNIAEDHFGDFGVGSLEDLLAAKLVATRVVPPDGAVILNADDPLLRTRGRAMPTVTWFSRSGRIPHEARQLVVEGDELVRCDPGTADERGGRPIATLDDVRAATGAAAGYEIENVLAAAALALALGVPESAVAPALRRFDPAADNPGRGTLLDLDGVTILVDYGHNPHGIAALGGLLDTIPATRRLVLLGQAGDREDEAIAALARSALTLRPDRVILKELGEYRRGRGPGEVRTILRNALVSRGYAAECVEDVESEVDAVRRALAWSRPGDLLVLLVHENRDAVLALLREAGATTLTKALRDSSRSA